MSTAVFSRFVQIARSGSAGDRLLSPSPPLSADALRIERLLATVRLPLAIGAFVLLGAATRLGWAAFVLFTGYIAFSGWIWSLQLPAAASSRLRVGLHAADITAVALLVIAIGGFHWALFGLYLFLPLAAAYRWGLSAAFATIGCVLGFLGLITLAGNSFLIPEHALYLGISGTLVGYIAGREKQCRDETALIAEICSGMRGERGMMGSLKSLFPTLLRLTGARAILLAAREPRHGRLFLWRLDDSSNPKVRSTELVPSEHDAYLFPMPVEAWYGVNPVTGAVSASTPTQGPDAFAARHPLRSFFAISLGFGPDWQARVFVLDPAGDGRQLPFLVRLLHQVGPALHSIYLQGRMHSRIGEMERARVARELHDQTVQSLIGLEMELAAWRRSASDGRPTSAERLVEFQNRLHEEILNLRELMQQLRPVYAEPRKLLSYMSEIVDRFQRETGIAASFISDVYRVDMSQEVCAALVRILQEALVNVRKHSGARNVFVTFGAKDSRWSLVIDDDGRGFAFTGRRRPGLDASCKGPAVIQERVLLLGGELTVDSDPARGARLEITVPGALHA